MLATLIAWTLTNSLAGPHDEPGRADPVRTLGEAVVEAAALDTPSARFDELHPTVRATCDLEQATSSWPWPDPGARAERVERLERFATWFFVGLAEREPQGLELDPSEATAPARVEVALVRASKSADTFVFELTGADAPRIVAVRAPGSDANELTGAAREILATGGLEALDRWLALELERPTETAGETVERLWDGLLGAGSSAESDFDGRYRALEPLVDSTHEFASIAVTRVGRSTYEGLSPERRRALVATLRELSIATYANRFDDTAGLEFEVRSDEAGPRDFRTVMGSLRKRGGERVEFEYLMQRRGARWVVLNVTADGVSDLAVKKVEYAEILDDGGIDRLLAELEQQIAKQRE